MNINTDKLFIWIAVADSKPPPQGGSLPLSYNRGPPGTSYGGGGKYTYYTTSWPLSNTSTQKPCSFEVKPESIIKLTETKYTVNTTLKNRKVLKLKIKLKSKKRGSMVSNLIIRSTKHSHIWFDYLWNIIKKKIFNF